MGRWGTSLLDLLCGFLGVMYILIAASSRQEGMLQIPAEQPWFSVVGRGTRSTATADSRHIGTVLPDAVEVRLWPEGEPSENRWLVYITGHGEPQSLLLPDLGLNYSEDLQITGETSPEVWIPCPSWEELPERLKGASAWGNVIEVDFQKNGSQ